MNSSPSNERENRLGEILADYMQRVDQGELVDTDALLAAHPEFAEELQSYFDDAEQVEDFAGPPGETMVEASRKIAPLGSIRYFGDYELLEEIARGGMGVVYRARQTSLGRIVAVKMILAGQLASEADVQRFYTEAQAAANLDHPGITPIYEVGSHQGQHYFSMAFVEGESLTAKINDGSLDAELAASIIEQAAQAVHYAHQQGVIHRDLKPANILLDEVGRPRVTDFGLAKRLSQESSLTATGQIVGTPSYMPPEQAAGDTEKIDPHSDVYALGATLYALLTGRPPFQAASVAATLRQVVEQEPVSPRRLNPTIPKDLETITLKCLHKETARRYGSALELAEDLHRFRDGKPIVARPVGQIMRFYKTVRRHPATSVAAAFAGLAGASLVVVWLLWALDLRRQRDSLQRTQQFAMEQWNEAHKQMVNARLHQARALRAAGDRANSLRVLAETPQSQVIETLRREVIETLAMPGFEPVHELPFGEVEQVRISPNGKLLAASGRFAYGEQAKLPEKQRRRSVVVWELRSGKRIAEMPTSNPHIVGASGNPWEHGVLEIGRYKPFEFLPGKDNLLMVYTQPLKDQSSGRVVLWDPLPDRIVREFPARDVVVSGDGRLVAWRPGRTWLVHECAGGESPLQLVGEATGYSLHAIDAAGRAVVQSRRSTRLVEIHTGKELHKLPNGMRVPAIGPRGEIALVAHDEKTSDENAGALTQKFSLRRIDDSSSLFELPHVDSEKGSYATQWRFSPSGDRLAYQTNLPGQMTAVWDRGRNAIVSLLPGCVESKRGKRHPASFSPDGRLLALHAAPHTQTVGVWDIEQRAHIGNAQCFAPQWSPDGRWLVGMFDPGPSHKHQLKNPVHLFTVGNGRVVRVWRVHQSPASGRVSQPVRFLEFDSTGDRLIVNNSLWSLNVSTAPHPDDPPHTTLVASPIGEPVDVLRPVAARKLIGLGLPRSRDKEEALSVFVSSDRDSWRPLSTPRVSEKAINPDPQKYEFSGFNADSDLVAVSASGSHLVICGEAAWRHRASPNRTTSRGRELLRQNLQNGKTVIAKPPIKVRYGLRCLALSPDGGVIATGHENGIVLRRWADGEEIGRAEPARRWQSDENLSSGWESKSGSPGSYHYADYFRIHRLIFSPDGKRIFAAAEQGRLVILDGSARQLLLWEGHHADVHGLAVHPRRQMIASGGDDGAIRLWNVDLEDSKNKSAPQQLAVWTAHGDAATALAFDPEGRFLVSGSANGQFKIWDLKRIQRGLEKLDLAWKTPPSHR